jgi:hypothetical protein
MLVLDQHGAALLNWTNKGNNMVEKNWKEIIAKLMEKAENTATSDAERENISKRVMYLMAKHGIEEAMLSAREDRTAPLTKHAYRLLAPYIKQRVTILHNISIAFGCRAIFDSQNNRMTVYGYEDDQEKVFMLYGSLIIQMFTGLGQVVKPVDVHGKTFNGSWVTGYAFTVSQRVRDAYERARRDVQAETTGNGMELVLNNRSLAVQNMFRGEHPRTRSMSGSSATHAGAYAAGSAAGRNANIGQTGVGGASGTRAIGS